MKEFIISRKKSLKFAIKGMFLLLKTEQAIISHFFFSIIFIAMGFFFEISRMEWIVQLLLIGFVLTTEALNTVIEKLCDFIHPDHHSRIGFIKDISAGAVSFAVIFSLIIAFILYYPYFF